MKVCWYVSKKMQIFAFFVETVLSIYQRKQVRILKKRCQDVDAGNHVVKIKTRTNSLIQTESELSLRLGAFQNTSSRRN